MPNGATLPGVGAATIGGVSLRPGQPIGTRVWITDDDVDDLSEVWEALAAQYPTTGLWPLKIGTRFRGGNIWSEPDEANSDPTSRIEAVDPLAVLGDTSAL